MTTITSDSTTSELEDRLAIIELIGRMVLLLDAPTGTRLSPCSPKRSTTIARRSPAASRRLKAQLSSWADGAT